MGFSEYAEKPIEFAYEVLGVKYLTTDQKRILESVRDNKTTNVQSCHGSGKSFLASVATLHWVYAVGGLCITSAPTERQVKQILWSEIRRAYGSNRGKLGGKAGELFLTVTEDHRAFGFSSSDKNQNSFQGIHADKLLVILDEACGISPEIDDGAESCIVGSNNRIARIGNPIVDGTPFARSCKRSHIKITAWSHPNVAWAYNLEQDGIHRIKQELRPSLFDSEGRVLDRNNWGADAIASMQTYLDSIGAIEIKGAISVEWIENARQKYQENSAFWESRIEARFPLDGGASIIPRRYFYLARLRYDQEVERLSHTPKKTIATALRHLPPRYGVDVGDGGDAHAIARWQGNVLWSVKPYPTLGDELDTARAVTYLKAQIREHGDGMIGVDNVGVGAGTLAIAKSEGLMASGIRWGNAASDNRFANLKAEQYWLLREEAERGDLMIAPLGEDEEELQEDLANTYYEETVKGQVKIEDKKKTRERLGRSPNCGDAVVYGYHAQSGINPLLV